MIDTDTILKHNGGSVFGFLELKIIEFAAEIEVWKRFAAESSENRAQLRAQLWKCHEYLAADDPYISKLQEENAQLRRLLGHMEAERLV